MNEDLPDFEIIESLETHPLEDLFNLPEGTTAVQHNQIVAAKNDPTEQIESYDSKDLDIDSKLDQIYNMSLNAYRDQVESTRGVEPKFAARTNEVANQFLTTALNAVQVQANIKKQKDTNNANTKRGPQTVNQNLIMDRNVLLRMLKEQSE